MVWKNFAVVITVCVAVGGLAALLAYQAIQERKATIEALNAMQGEHQLFCLSLSEEIRSILSIDECMERENAKDCLDTPMGMAFDRCIEFHRASDAYTDSVRIRAQRLIETIWEEGQ